jgi:uncharacterized membrane protein
VAGTPMGRFWRKQNAADDAAQEDFEGVLGSFLTIGMERNDTQDFIFGLGQLTDVTTKALSPGVNDPTTAVHSLGHTSALICEIARHDLRDQVYRGEDGQVRVICRRHSFAPLLDEAVTQPRRYGAADPVVMARLFGLLREVGWSVHSSERREAVYEQLARLRATVAAQELDDTERAGLNKCDREVQDALQGRWSGER